jgi:hypothetical protein
MMNVLSNSANDLFIDGELIATRAFDKLGERIGEVVSGNVLELGLGFGVSRRAICSNEYVSRVRTVECNEDVINMWRRGDDSFVASAEDDRHVVVCATAESEVATFAAAVPTYQSVVIDLDTDLILDPDFRSDLHDVLSRVGNRLVFTLSTQPRTFTVPGFKVRADINEHGRTLYVADRWDPRAHLGSNRPGIYRSSAHGWVRRTPAEIGEDDEREIGT